MLVSFEPLLLLAAQAPAAFSVLLISYPMCNIFMASHLFIIASQKLENCVCVLLLPTPVYITLLTEVITCHA